MLGMMNDKCDRDAIVLQLTQLFLCMLVVFKGYGAPSLPPIADGEPDANGIIQVPPVRALW